MTLEQWNDKYELIEDYLQSFIELNNTNVIRSKKDQNKIDDNINNIMFIIEDTIVSNNEIYDLFIDGIEDAFSEFQKKGYLRDRKTFSDVVNSLLRKMKNKINE